MGMRSTMQLYLARTQPGRVWGTIHPFRRLLGVRLFDRTLCRVSGSSKGLAIIENQSESYELTNFTQTPAVVRASGACIRGSGENPSHPEPGDCSAGGPLAGGLRRVRVYPAHGCGSSATGSEDRGGLVRAGHAVHGSRRNRFNPFARRPLIPVTIRSISWRWLVRWRPATMPQKPGSYCLHCGSRTP